LAELCEVAFYPLVLLLAQTALSDIYGQSGKGGRCGVPFDRCGIAVMPAELLLLVGCANRRGQLDGNSKLVVVGVAQVLNEIAGPRLAIATIRLEVAGNVKSRHLADSYQLVLLDQFIQFGVVLNSDKVQPIDFLV